MILSDIINNKILNNNIYLRWLLLRLMLSSLSAWWDKKPMKRHMKFKWWDNAYLKKRRIRSFKKALRHWTMNSIRSSWTWQWTSILRDQQRSIKQEFSEWLNATSALCRLKMILRSNYLRLSWTLLTICTRVPLKI